jgi:hypothetical protein
MPSDDERKGEEPVGDGFTAKADGGNDQRPIHVRLLRLYGRQKPSLGIEPLTDLRTIFGDTLSMTSKSG